MGATSTSYGLYLTDNGRYRNGLIWFGGWHQTSASYTALLCLLSRTLHRKDSDTDQRSFKEMEIVQSGQEQLINYVNLNAMLKPFDALLYFNSVVKPQGIYFENPFE